MSRLDCCSRAHASRTTSPVCAAQGGPREVPSATAAPPTEASVRGPRGPLKRNYAGGKVVLMGCWPPARTGTHGKGSGTHLQQADSLGGWESRVTRRACVVGFVRAPSKMHTSQHNETFLYQKRPRGQQRTFVTKKHHALITAGAVTHPLTVARVHPRRRAADEYNVGWLPHRMGLYLGNPRRRFAKGRPSPRRQQRQPGAATPSRPPPAGPGQGQVRPPFSGGRKERGSPTTAWRQYGPRSLHRSARTPHSPAGGPRGGCR